MSALVSALALKFRKVLHVAVCVCFLSWSGDVRCHESFSFSAYLPPRPQKVCVCCVGFHMRSARSQRPATATGYRPGLPSVCLLMVSGHWPIVIGHRPNTKRLCVYCRLSGFKCGNMYRPAGWRNYCYLTTRGSLPNITGHCHWQQESWPRA